MPTTDASGTPMTAAWPKGDPVAHEQPMSASCSSSSSSDRSTVKLSFTCPPTFTK